MEAIFGLSAGQFAAMAAIVALGGFMRGFAGFGTTLVMVPLFTLIIDPAPAVMIGILIDVAAMTTLFPRAARQAEWRSIVPMLLSGLIATPIGVYALLVVDADAMRIAIAVMVILSAAVMLSGWTYRGERTPVRSFGVGLVAGISGAATGIGGPPMALYFMADGGPAARVRASLNAASFLRMGYSGIAIAIAGTFGLWAYATIGALLPVMLAFTWVGSKMFGAVSDSTFRRALLIILIVIGGIVLVRSIA